jgi:WhiB family redox-sensing transcriptional regulator
VTAGIDQLTADLGRWLVDPLVRRRARCADPRGSYTSLFFSENMADVAKARAICSRCAVRELCLVGAVERREPFGVWGGECLRNGEIVQARRGRGRPPNVTVPTVVDEVTGYPSAPIMS